MIPTFVIGLREALEAALIVSIIAAFLRRNGRSLAPLAVGVGAALLLSVVVGVTLWLVETSLPQAAQEGMETVIGAIAVFFVAGMVVWMSTHARTMRAELESAAQHALGTGSSRALAVMAFLAVLKEGFETAVFLLATFSSSRSTGLAAGGAALGIACAVVLGFGLYRGGVRLNLSRFFTFTSVFLVLVAAGLVVSALGTAHEAGWLNAGQQRTADLGWLSPAGSIRGALITGVLGIPAHPVLIQALGWLAFAVPMTLYVLWPAGRRPGATAATRLRLGTAAGLAVAAAALALAVPGAGLPALGPVKLVDAAGAIGGTVRAAGGEAVLDTGASRTTMALRGGRADEHLGVDGAVLYTERLRRPAPGLPRTLSLAQLVAINGGRLPVGVSAQQAPGPFRAAWSRNGERRLWLVGDQIVDFSQTDVTAVTITGGGLATSRTLTVAGSMPGGAVVGGSLAAQPSRVKAAQAAAASQSTAQVDRRFWGRTLPLVLAIVALALLAWTARTTRVRRFLPRAARAVAVEHVAD